MLSDINVKIHSCTCKYNRPHCVNPRSHPLDLLPKLLWSRFAHFQERIPRWISIMTVCFRMPPVAIPWKLRDLHTSILSNNLHSGEINKYFWKFCLHLLMSKFYHWLVHMVFTRILKYYLSWWKRRHLCCWVKSLVATLQTMAEWSLRDRGAVSLTTSACLAIFFRSSTKSLLQDNVFVARSQH